VLTRAGVLIRLGNLRLAEIERTLAREASHNMALRAIMASMQLQQANVGRLRDGAKSVLLVRPLAACTTPCTPQSNYPLLCIIGSPVSIFAVCDSWQPLRCAQCVARRQKWAAEGGLLNPTPRRVHRLGRRHARERYKVCAPRSLSCCLVRWRVSHVVRLAHRAG
jgi:hypothetical protein